MGPAINQEKLVNIILHPAVLVIPVFFMFIFFFPTSIERYSLDLLLRNDLLSENERIEYSDINSDTLIEKIHAYNLITNATIIAYTNKNSIYEAWNLRGYWHDRPEFVLGDLDKDGVKELYGLTISSGDTLIINQLHLYKKELIYNSSAVCPVLRYNGFLDHKYGILGFTDISGDGSEDLVFYNSAGFTLKPRTIYAWDVANDTIIRSDVSGINYKNFRQGLYERKKDGPLNLVYTTNYATDNYKETIPFPDTASYAVVLTTNLDYLFPPVAMSGPQSYTITFPLNSGNHDAILSVTYNPRSNENRTIFNIFDMDGKVIQTKNTDFFDQGLEQYLVNDQIVLFRLDAHKPELGILDNNLNYTRKTEFREQYSPVRVMNLDVDPEDEILFLNQLNRSEVGILDDDLKTFTTVEIPPEESGFSAAVLAESSSDKSEFFMQFSKHSYQFEYAGNMLYPFRFIYYAGIYVFLFAILLLLQKLFTYRIQRRKELEEKLVSYQLQSIMNQLNPHFTFNAINAIGNAVIEGRNVEAYEYFAKLSGLLRESMKNALQPFKTLEEEIAFVRKYLEIEKYRFTDKLTWSIELDPEVDTSILVPKMLIHLFVENSIKHGIFNSKGGGDIAVNIRQVKDVIQISVTDNGVGRARAYEIEQIKGEGLKILDKYLSIYRKIERRHISYSITDLQNSDSGRSGTIAAIRIKSG